MNRRIALKQMGLISAGAMLLPSCLHEARKLSVSLNNIVITGDQEALLAELVGSIIPATETPGARELEVHKFVLRMVDDCQDAENQQKFVTGLGQLDETTKRFVGKSFEDSTAEERHSLLSELESKKEQSAMGDGKESQIPTFYSLTKRYTVQGYLSSEYIMTNVLVYNMVPGGFNGCVEIKDKNDIQTVIG